MVLEYVDFITGALSVGFAYALFKDNIDPEEESEEDNEDHEGDYGQEEFTGRLVTLSCQGCRKLKKHREVKKNLYQCTKCKRLVDLR